MQSHMNCLFTVTCMACAGLLAVGSPSANAQDCNWELKSETGPEGRSAHRLAFDSKRGVTVLFGGWQGLPVRLGDTWEWDGENWELLSDSGPEARNSMGMAFDSQRGVTVLYGGRTSSGYVGDTWEWDGQKWTNRDASAPGRRAAPMAYDSKRGVTVLFGGWSGGSHLADTWEWDGTTWEKVADTGPSPRSAQLAYDSDRGVTVLFGGTTYQNRYLGDTWEWDGVAWEKVSDTGPSPRLSRMAYDDGRGVTVLYGGYDGGSYRGDTWEWDGMEWREVCNSGPGDRSSHDIAFDSNRGVAVLFGGDDPDDPGGSWFGDSWERGTVADCLDLSVDNLVAGERATFTVTDGTPGAMCAILWSDRDGRYQIDNGTWCADFGFFLPNQATKRLVGTGRFDQHGVFTKRLRVPSGISGMEIRFQAAMSDTCPDDCMSNIWRGVID